MKKVLLQSAGYLWASPATAIGLTVGILGLATRGRAQPIRGILEFHGGAVTWILEHFPGSPMAMTLGHVVIGLTQAALDISREHELVHVRQYERWGPAFLPAYFGASLICWLRGRDPYRDNPFEREAFEVK